MKYAAATILIFCLHAGFYVHGQRVSLHADRLPLKQVFQQVTKQTGTLFLYDDALLADAKPVTIRVSNELLEPVLSKIFADQPLGFSIVNKTVIISRKVQRPKVLGDSVRFIRGVVRAEGKPLPGASVLVKNTALGTSTNPDGQFELAAEENTVLVISSVGFESKEIAVIPGAEYNIELKVAVNKLDETVFIAYGTTTKRINTGNVGKVSAAEIERQPVSNPLSGLQGRVAGVYVQQNSGVPGGAFSVQIRGRNSLRANGNDPLYLVDGIPYPASSVSSEYTSSITGGGSPISFINPSDIASVEILKDADATAIYGSRGANGVVLITTKKSKEGRSFVAVSISQAMGKVSNKLDLLDRRQYLDMRYEAYRNDGIDFTSPAVTNAYDLKIWDTSRSTDWQDQLIGETTSLTRAQLSISGGSSTTQFLVSGNFLKETTAFPGDFADEKSSFHFNVNHNSADKKLQVALSGNYLRDQNNLLPLDLTSAAVSLPAIAPSLITEDGKINFENGTFINNPQVYLAGKYRARAANLVSDIRISYALTPHLRLIVSGGYNALDNNERRISPSYAAYPARPSGNTYFATTNIKTWQAEPQVNFEREFRFGKITAMAGASFQQTQRQGNTLLATGFASDALLENPLAASDVYIFEAAESDYRYQAVFGRINYQLKNRYLVNLTARRDGSSRFGPGRQFANFGAVGAGWIFSREEKIAALIPALSYGKLRGSFGITGSDQTGDYGFLDLWNSTNTPYAGSQGLYPNSLFNPLYSWESNKKSEGGLELGFVNDRILFTASYYRNRSSNQLVGLPLPGVTGFTSIQFNLPATVENKGWEFEISAVPVHRKYFKWTSGFNITFAKNRLVEYPGLGSSVYAQTYIIGEPLSVKRSFQSNGINAATGLFEVRDIDHDGQYTIEEDAVDLINAAPTAYGGWENNFTVKQFELSVFIQFVQQRATNLVSNFPAAGAIYSQPVDVLHRWTPSNINAIYQRFSATQGATAMNRYGQSDGGYSDASFARLKNVALNYHLPRALLQRFKLQQAKLSLQGQNLLTVTHYKGLDPETLSFRALPPMRIIAAGIQFTF